MHVGVKQKGEHGDARMREQGERPDPEGSEF